MITNLKKLYNESLVISETPILNSQYQWYVSEEGTFFGVEKDKLTPQEDQLLATLFRRFEPPLQTNMNEEQSVWHRFLFENETSTPFPDSSITLCRFNQFQTSKAISDQEDFETAVKALFPMDVTVLWIDKVNGIIIETSNNDKLEQVNIAEMLDTLISDFYVDIHFFVGQTYSIGNGLKTDFNWERICFTKALHYLQKQRIVRLYDIIPYLLLEKVDPSLTNKLSTAILQDLRDDKELLETIKVFLESNLNVSLAAKKLYMHRNSLQYRIDKFIEKTGIDIKHFQGALTTYLAIINTEQFNSR